MNYDRFEYFRRRFRIIYALNILHFSYIININVELLRLKTEPVRKVSKSFLLNYIKEISYTM